MMLRKIIPTAVTMAAMVAGFYSILASAAGDFLQAGRLIMVAMILDGLDGTLARFFKTTSKIGAELDTFVDLTAFGLAPAVLLQLSFLKDFGIWGLVLSSSIVLSGVYRLSRFRVVDPFRGQRGYLGLPITAMGGWIALFVIASETSIAEEFSLSLSHGPVALFFYSSVLVMTVLQISHVHYPKTTKNPRIFIPFSVLIILLFSDTKFTFISAVLLLAYGFFFAFFSPFAVKQHAPVAEAEEEEEVPIRHS